MILWGHDLSIKNAFEKLALAAFKQHEEFRDSTDKRRLFIIFTSPLKLIFLPTRGREDHYLSI